MDSWKVSLIEYRETRVNINNLRLSAIPETAGIYKFSDHQGKIIYIGKAINLKKRVGSYFNRKLLVDSKTRIMLEKARFLNYIKTSSDIEALLLEARLIKKYQPKYNVILKDDRHHLYIKITREEFPRVLFSRASDKEDGIYYGPFPSSRSIRNLLTEIRQIIPFCTQKPGIKKACFYSHLGLCFPCPAEIKFLQDKLLYRKKKKIYRRNIRLIKMLFNNGFQKIITLFTAKMKAYSARLEYEQARNVRDKIQKIKLMMDKHYSSDYYLYGSDKLDKIYHLEQQELCSILAKYFPLIKKITKIECYDVSNISGKFAVGAVVTFIKGAPAKNLYRKFKIKTIDYPNDFAMLKEIISRRLKHQEWILPDIFLIDGGRPQLKEISKVFQLNSLNIPLIGIAKRYEELVIPTRENFINIRLKNYTRAVNLIIRIRDETHRFAHKYFATLRLKSLSDQFGKSV